MLGICSMAIGWAACVSQVEVSPVENAISVVENKNQELRMLISQYQHRQPHGNVNQLSMCLNGVIDAAVNGGVARYQEVKASICKPLGELVWQAKDAYNSLPVISKSLPFILKCF